MGLNKKGMYLALGSMSFLVVSSAGVSAFESHQEQLKIDKERMERDNKRIAIEKARKEALISKYSGIHPDYVDYAYDSSIVWNKLSNKDYSNDEKIVFLTFDDGPSTTVTPEVLKVLKEKDVKATFFVMGKTIEQGGDEAKKILKEVYESGHSIGNHTYSHNYRKLYPNGKLNLNNFLEDLNQNEQLIQEILGNPNYHTRVYRAPGGTMSWRNMQELKDYSVANNMSPIDWNALNKDSEGKKKSSEQLVSESIKYSEGKDMVVLLMHDTYGKENTAKSLDRLIDWYKENGYTFKTLG